MTDDVEVVRNPDYADIQAGRVDREFFLCRLCAHDRGLIHRDETFQKNAPIDTHRWGRLEWGWCDTCGRADHGVTLPLRSAE